MVCQFSDELALPGALLLPVIMCAPFCRSPEASFSSQVFLRLHLRWWHIPFELALQ